MYCMDRIRLIAMVAALAGAASIAFGEPSETEKRGSIPIGTSQDGSGPSDGALIGGSTDIGRKTPQRAVNRCKELSGVLQEECLQDLELSTTSARQPAGVLPIKPAYDIYADPRRRRN
jgi:hypothetical protein